MDILGLLSTYGVTFAISVFIIFFTSIIKDKIPKKLRPYIAPMFALITAPFTPLFLPSVPTSVLLWVKESAIEWCREWILATLTYDMVIRLFRTSDNSEVKDVEQ